MRPCDRAGSTALQRSAGFTLLELLVVVILIGSVVGLALANFNIGDNRREMEQEVERLHSILRMVSDEALFQNKEFGFRIDMEKHYYEFVEYDPVNQQWVSPQGKLLQPGELPPWMLIEFDREDQEIKLVQSSDDDEAQKRPQIMLFSSGEVTPFELRLYRQRDAKPYVITTDGIGLPELAYPQDDDA